MQFTGLHDKQGKEYFDGDVAQWIAKDYVSKFLEKIVWHDGSWWFVDLITGDLLVLAKEKEATLRTIVGNIYMNRNF